MENKKLVKILLKDMSELEEMISEVKTNGNFDALEMEFLHTRAKGVLQLLQMLNSMETPVQKEIENQPPIQASVKVEEKRIEIEELPEIIEEKPAEIEVEEINVEEIVQEVAEEEINIEKLEAVISDESSHRVDESELELEDEKIAEANPRLGDSFLKEKSVNDLMADHKKLENKLSNRPVNNIQAAIGINDRYQFVRELFEGDSNKFTETVTALDNMKNIKEAVEYLHQNFKWRKSDFSLKFVNLVKRRFPNE